MFSFLEIISIQLSLTVAKDYLAYIKIRPVKDSVCLN